MSDFDNKSDMDAQAAFDKALRRLASRARGRVEMERYLAEKGFPPEAVQAAIEKLEGYGYINDGAFASMLVRDRMNLKPVGKNAISRELRRLGIGEEDAAGAMEQYGGEDELATALKQAQKDMKRTAGETDKRKRRAKVYSGLARRGFSQDVVDAVLSRLFNGPSDD